MVLTEHIEQLIKTLEIPEIEMLLEDESEDLLDIVTHTEKPLEEHQPLDNN